VSTLAQVLADWLAGLRFDDLPDSVKADAQLRILDTLGVAIAASPLPIGRAVRAAAAALGSGDAASLVGGGRSTAALAALVNGTLAHALDFDDTHNASVMHPSGPAVAVALAMTEAVGGNGQDLLLATAAGIELNCRLGMVAPGAFHAAGQHPTSVLGTAAAALVAARLLQLSAPALVAAAGIAGSQASGILEAYADGTWSKSLHPGWAAHAGIVAARLAQAGFTGPASVFEGRYGIFRSHLSTVEQFDFDVVTRGLSDRWHMLDTAFKLYPNAHAIHAFIEAALVLRGEHHLTADDVLRARMDVPAEFVGQIAEPRAAKLEPRTTTHARASLYYAVAVAIADGHVGMQHYTDAAIARPDLLQLAARMSHVAVPSPDGVIRFRGTVAIDTRDGRTLIKTLEEANGTGSRALRADQVEQKFRSVVAGVIPKADCERLIAAVRELPEGGRVDKLFASAQLATA
jgi:2-methylcitrate dehydratase PrpD